jgi:RHS repeat-associated protein
LDAETGLYYYNARYYDPQLGRFTQPDTTIPDLSNPQSYNRYSYCVNDPLRYTDPDGRAPSDWANAWSSAINRGATYVSAGPSHWIYNGTVGTLNSLVGGLAEPLRFGSTAGALSGSGHATAGQIALGTLQEAGRAAAIIPVGAAIGKGTGALVTSLTAGGEEEAVGELTQAASQAGKASQQQYYIENGVRRSVASREAGAKDIPATIFREGQPPENTTLNLDQLNSPKPEIPLDPRFQNIKPPIQTPIQVQPMGVPGQLPTVPIHDVKIVPPGGEQ